MNSNSHNLIHFIEFAEENRSIASITVSKSVALHLTNIGKINERVRYAAKVAKQISPIIIEHIIVADVTCL